MTKYELVVERSRILWKKRFDSGAFERSVFPREFELSPAYMSKFVYNARAPEFFCQGGKNLKKRALFLLKRHCQQKQILVVMLQFEILVDMIEFQFAQNRLVSWKKFILLICYFGSINFSASDNSF